MKKFFSKIAQRAFALAIIRRYLLCPVGKSDRPLENAGRFFKQRTRPSSPIRSDVCAGNCRLPERLVRIIVSVGGEGTARGGGIDGFIGLFASGLPFSGKQYVEELVVV